jgi:anti-sigma B factor antagonist
MRNVDGRSAGERSGLATPSEQFSVEVLPDRERVVVIPHGELDVATAGRLAAEIDELTSRGFDAIVLDLRATSFIDSSGMHLLLDQTARPDAQVTLIDGAQPVRRVIDLAGVRHLLRFEPAP